MLIPSYSQDGVLMTMIKENNLQHQPSSLAFFDQLVRVRVSWASEMFNDAAGAYHRQTARVRIYRASI